MTPAKRERKKSDCWYAVAWATDDKIIYDFSIRDTKARCIRAWEVKRLGSSFPTWGMHKVVPISIPKVLPKQRSRRK